MRIDGNITYLCFSGTLAFGKMELSKKKSNQIMDTRNVQSEFELKSISSEFVKIQKQQAKNYRNILIFIVLSSTIIFSSFFLIENLLLQKEAPHPL